MTMTDLTDPSEVRGKKLVDPAGADIGEAREIYMEHGSDRPAFALVKTGLFGSKHTFVPLSGASLDGPRIWVTVDKDRVRDAPKVDPDQELTPQEEGELYRHYGLEASTAQAGAEPTASEQTQEHPSGEAEPGRAEAFSADRHAGPAGAREEPDFSGTAGGRARPERPDTAPASERPGTESERPATAESAQDHRDAQRETFPHRSSGEEGLPRLRRYVVTEEVEVTVPVQREEVRVEPAERPADARAPTDRDDQAPAR
jgi:Domain of unknown function (DUF2382)/PRC-barrel domain